jgi:hypothetical protein
MSHDFCEVCKKKLYPRSFYIVLTADRLTKKSKYKIFETLVCTQRCLKKSIEMFNDWLEVGEFLYSGKPEKRVLYPEHPSYPNMCAYCGKDILDKEIKYRVDMESGPYSKRNYLVFNYFCSKKCFLKAISLKDKYIDYSTLAYFDKENCIKNRMEKDKEK